MLSHCHLELHLISILQVVSERASTRTITINFLSQASWIDPTVTLCLASMENDPTNKHYNAFLITPCASETNSQTVQCPALRTVAGRTQSLATGAEPYQQGACGTLVIQTLQCVGKRTSLNASPKLQLGVEQGVPV